MSECPSKTKPVYYRKYDDNILVLFPNKTQVDSFESHLNQRHKHTKFESEVEADDILPFLYVSIIRENNSMD